MKIFSFFQLLLLFVAYETAAQVPLCRPAEEQKSYNLTLNITENSHNVIWYKESFLVVICPGGKCEATNAFPGYTASVSSLTSTLMIPSVTRQSAGTYICEGGTSTSCNLKVYARPTSVSCHQAVFQADSVTVVCTVTRIYPSPVCQFGWTQNSIESPALKETIITMNQTEYGEPVYYNASCSWKLPARNFSVGSHQFQVRVYPNVTGGDSDTAYGVDSGWTSPQSVGKPQFRDPDNLKKIHQERVNGTVVINVPVLGYPEPTVSLSSDKYNLSSTDYVLAYTKLEPPYGNVLLAINIRNERFFQNYTLHINNAEGALTYSFKIVEGDTIFPVSQEGFNVGAVVGGVIAGVLVTAAAAVLLLIFLKRRGHFPNRDNNGKNADRTINVRQTDTNENSPKAQVIENSHCEEIVDPQSDMPDNQIIRDRQVSYTNQIISDDYANQISNIQDKEVEYENTVCMSI